MSNGVLDSFFTALQNNPSVAAGSCTFVVAFALVAGNAFYAQSGSHPDPIWATRDHTTTQSVTQAARSVKTQKIAPKTIPTPAKGDIARLDNAGINREKQLVSSIQSALAEKGFFSGEVDGLMGPLTSNSIREYEAYLGIKETGEASAELFQRIKGRSSTGSNTTTITNASSTASNADNLYNKAILKLVQSGIAKAGIADIEADGIYGKQTEAAIMNFQRRYDLDVTGKPDAKLLKQLQKLNLIEPGQSST